MRPRDYAFTVLSLAMAALCARLGVWQLSRLGQRRARNALVERRLERAEVPVDSLPADTALARFRRVRASGTLDHAHEFVLTARTHDGSPGVYIVTPLRRPGHDTAVLVNRGWVYSPDGAMVDLTPWRGADTGTVHGFVAELPLPGHGPVAASRDTYALRWVDPALVARRVGAPVTPYILVETGDTAGTGANRTPARVDPPPLDEGPHQNYAIQWFSFAAISLGGLVVYFRTRKE